MTASPPRAALWLGYAGLLPAAAAAAVLAFGPERLAATAVAAHLIYAAIIASFIGGAWWGLASARADAAMQPRLLAISVVPSLIAWGQAMVGGSVGLVGMGILFAALLPIDTRLTQGGLAPSWWLALRVPLSVGMALLALASGLLLG
ncbi:MAG: DUF3429 domain-containing protein [Alphaproteobacteria bacterium]|nr:DUF3429 domain-containing protein [Alphaproteobacteria bacterium]